LGAIYYQTLNLKKIYNEARKSVHNLCFSPPVGLPDDDATLFTKSAKKSA